ncbi:MAG TPA: NAD(+) synthase, partial [Gemmatimonadales bacterium]|nr:NAD(+) synthase [Gemmatimonadales bacterium]
GLAEPMTQSLQAGSIRTALTLDAPVEAAYVEGKLRQLVAETMHRRGAVVAMSGGVDSSVCAGIAAAALGPSRVVGLLLPERESDPADAALAREWAGKLGIEVVVEDITAALEGLGCYARRDAAIRRVVPDYGPGWRSKIALAPAGADAARGLNVFRLVVRAPDGATSMVRLPPAEYREIVAATNDKQRVRKLLDYFHADRLHYAVIGTPNRLEYDQGFFVKGGDGLADVKPIAHLYKSQVYQLARHYGVPAGITDRSPTTGTYGLPQSQGEFYFQLEPRSLDVVLYARNAGLPAEVPARELGLPVEDVEHLYQDIARKRATTRYLHLGAQLVRPVPELD